MSAREDYKHGFQLQLSTVGPEIETVFLPLGNLEASWEGFPSGSGGKESACKAGNIGHDVSSRSLDPLEDPLEEKMATHSSILAWRIPWTEEPGRLQSMGSQRAGHTCVTKHKAQTAFENKSKVMYQ